MPFQCTKARAFGTSRSLSEPKPYWLAAGVMFGRSRDQPAGVSVVSCQSSGEEKYTARLKDLLLARTPICPLPRECPASTTLRQSTVLSASRNCPHPSVGWLVCNQTSSFSSRLAIESDRVAGDRPTTGVLPPKMNAFRGEGLSRIVRSGEACNPSPESPESCRHRSAAEAERLQRRLDALALERKGPDTEVRYTLRIGRPPFASPDGRSLALAKQAQAIYAELDGRPLYLIPGGGAGTDAGYASLSGKPAVLESLGLAGWGYHARN